MTTTTSDVGIKYSGEIEIVAIEVFSHKRERIDIAAQMVELSIYEDIFTNTIHGTIAISDSFDLIHNFPFIGEELINIKLKTPTMGDRGAVDYFGYVYKISDRHYTTERGQVYLIHFCSFEHIVDMNKKVSKSFKGNISDLVEEIFKSDEFLASNKNLVLERTGNNIVFASPFWNPLKTINWLATRALKKENGSPSFLFYETLDNRFNFVSLDSMYMQKPKQGVHYRYDNYTRMPTDTGSTRNLDLDYGIIRDLYVEEVFDYASRSESGMYASRLINTNLLSKTIKTTTYDYHESFPKTNHLGGFPVSSPNLLKRRSSAIFSTTNSEFVYDGQRDFKIDQWFAQRKSLMGQAYSVHKADIVVSGRLDLHAGDCVTMELAQRHAVNRGDGKQEIVSNYFTGKFLIAAIHHRIEGGTHNMVMQCFTESLSKGLE